MKRLAPVLVVCALAAAACSSSTKQTIKPGLPSASGGPVVTTAQGVDTSPAASPGATALSWHSCPGDLGVDAKSDCTNLDVPLDRSGKVSGTISLQLVRRKHTGSAAPLGSLLLNPGGPGASTVQEFDFLYDGLDSSLKQKFDVVGWDPRGTGGSDPVRCVDGKTLDRLLAASPDITSAAGLAQVKQDAQTYVDGCESSSGKELPFIGTVDSAKDMDAIRAALGDANTSYLGYSYGTELGYVYASLFPDKVRALVLDGAIDPTLTLLDHGKSQTIGFQKALDSFLADCAGNKSQCAWKFSGDVHAAYRAIEDQAKSDPIRTKTSSRPLTDALFVSGVAAALYSRDSWQYLQQALQAAQDGDGTVMLALADSLSGRHDDGTYDNLQDAFTAISCIDQPVPDGTQPWIDAAKGLEAAAPDFADEGTLAPTGPGFPCSLFKVRPSTSQIPATVTKAPGALIVGSTGDPATPYSEAQGMTKAYSGSVLVTRQGEGHTGYTDSACVRDAADAYLLTGTLPKPGIVCSS